MWTNSGATDPEETSVEFSTRRRSSDLFVVEVLMKLMCKLVWLLCPSLLMEMGLFSTEVDAHVRGSCMIRKFLS